MQNRYAGDIGDFSKFALLRCLAQDDLSVGLLWWLTADEDNGDGGDRATRYLHKDRRKLRACDPTLYDRLQKLVHGGNRSVDSLEKACFAPTWVGHGELVPVDDGRGPWLERGLRQVASADIVCLDPDNGLLPSGSTTRRAKRDKYVLADELQQVAAGRQVLVLYQHLTRRGSADAQRDEATQRVQQLLERPVVSARWRRVSGRLYLIVLGTPHDRVVVERLAAMRTTWGHGPGEHFTLHLSDE